jgi:PEP-CTERM motif
MSLNRFLTSILVAAAAVCVAARAWAADITITENGDGIPTLTTSGVTLIGTAPPTLLPEFVALTGSVPVTPGTAPLVNGAVVLTEPASDPFGPRQSDIIVLEAGAPNLDLGTQAFNLLFVSDGVQEFDILISSNPNALTLLETGNVQAIGGASLLNTEPFLTINVQSDLHDPEAPEPTTLALLGLAFAGIRLAKRRKLNSQ